MDTAVYISYHAVKHSTAATLCAQLVGGMQSHQSIPIYTVLECCVVSGVTPWTVLDCTWFVKIIRTLYVFVVAAVSVALAEPYKNYYNNNYYWCLLLSPLTILHVTLLPMVFYHSHTTEYGIRPLCVVLFLFFLTYITYIIVSHISLCSFFYWMKIWRFHLTLHIYNHITEYWE